MAKTDAKEIVRVKGMGFLFNRDSENLFNCRVITENGGLNAKQLQTISEACEKFGNGEVAFTSRMCVEIQKVPYENIDPIIEYLGQAGLKTGGTGDRVRPVVACKGNTCVFGLVPSADVAKKIHDRFYDGYRQVELPHKFKIAVADVQITV